MKLTILAVLFLSLSARAQSVVFQENFENGFANWTMSGLWNAQETSEHCSSAQLPFPSGSNCAWYGAFTSTCWFVTSPITPQYLTYTQPIVLPATNGSIQLSFRTWSDTESSTEWDMKGAQVKEISSATWTQLPLSFNSNFWRLDTRDLSAFAGQTIQLRFAFNAVDGMWNDGAGWYVDDIAITEDPTSTPVYVACAADGTWYRGCPCISGTAGPGRGCPSSLSPTGAGLSGSGSLSMGSDSLVLHMDGMSPASATLFQATGFSYGSLEFLGGDGVVCVEGSFIRLVTRFAPGGVLDFPSAGDASISALGFVAPGQTRYYAARYRDAALFCTTATFNVTNTVAAYWRP